MALSHGLAAGCRRAALFNGVSQQELRIVEQLIQRGLQSPPTSSVGRLFDAVAALAGVRQRVTHEAQAAMELEWLAGEVEPDGSYPFAIEAPPSGSGEAPEVIDTRPLIRAVDTDVAAGTPFERIARRFHDTLVEMISVVAGRIAARTGLNVVVLSGGVFQNAVLLGAAAASLTHKGFRVVRHRRVPPGDGGLSLGQLAVAAARLSL